MKEEHNYETTIWLGLREQYSDHIFEASVVKGTIAEWCTEIKQCVTVTPTEFIYVEGGEPGLMIKFINYPRFPHSKAEIKKRAIELATLLMKKYGQHRVSITFAPPVHNGTMMLENKKLK